MSIDILGDEGAGDLVVFDGVRFTFSAHFEGLGRDSCARLMRAASKVCGKRLFVKSNGPLRFQLDLAVEPNVVARPTYTLHAYDTDDGLILTGGSSIELNLLLPLRQKYGVIDSVIGLDRKRNFCKPTAEMDESDVVSQLACIGASVDGLLDLVAGLSATATLVSGQATLSAAEVCHDLATESAEEIVRATCRIPMAGTRSSWQQTFDCSTGQGRMPTWHFATRKNGPVLKGYLKAPGLPRTECSCLKREQVVACVGRRSNAPLSADGLKDLAEEFYLAAGELCCAALDHVRDVARGYRSQVELRRELEPLHFIAEGQRVSGGYTPNEAAQRTAERILNELYEDGLAIAVGLRKGTKVRDVLELLVKPGGPLVRGATNGIYCVSPAFGAGASKAGGASTSSDPHAVTGRNESERFEELSLAQKRE